jgi:hypothetical protein
MNDPDLIKFKSACPKGHTMDLKFKREELLNALENANLYEPCGACGSFWQPIEQEKLNIGKRLDATREP